MTISDIVIIASGICLALFAAIGMIDGLYLHLVRYRLYAYSESRFEHVTHTARAILFVPILVLVFMRQSVGVELWLASAFVLLDLLVLTVDALNEGESRSFMGGLPKWEYVIHLFANGFHFAAIALALALRPLAAWLATANSGLFESGGLAWLAANLLPGAMILALLHLFLLWQPVAQVWDRLILGLTCCTLVDPQAR